MDAPKQDKPSETVSANPTAGEAALARTDELPFDFMAVSEPPTSLEAKKQLQEAMDDYIRQRLDAALSRPDREALRHGALAEAAEAGSDRIVHALDKIILDMAATLRGRLFFSDSVLGRIWAWCEVEPDGPARLEQLMKQLARGVQTRLGTARMPITPEHRKFKELIQPEIKLLRNFLRSKQAQQNRAMNEKTLLYLANTELERLDCPYPGLQNNRNSFANLVHSQTKILVRLVNGDISPATFTDGWVARETHWSIEGARQAMSKAWKSTRRCASQK